MSRLDQHEAMVNYFNSLLTDPASPSAMLPKPEKEHDHASQKEVLEKTFNSESLSRMLESVTAEAFSEPEAATAVADEPRVSTAAETEPCEEPEVSSPEPAATAPEAEADMPQTAVLPDTVTQTRVSTETAETARVSETSETESTTETETAAVSTERWCNIETGSEFTALLFKVAGVVLAAPLFTLGGIFKPARIDSIFGKPEWYAGMTCIQKQNVSVVDTAKWMLPGKKIIDHEYKFVILCKDKKWCLQCDELLGTKTIKREDVKWRVIHGDRPWLAGILKKDMCALLHITELEKMLTAGLDIYMNQPPKTLSRRS